MISPDDSGVPPDDLGQMPTADFSRMEELCERLELTWKEFEDDGSGDGVNLEPFLQEVAKDLRGTVLYELIKTDMPFRLENGLDWDLDFYVEKWRELGGAEKLSAGMILEEYLVRKNHGLRISLSKYKQRFPKQYPDLERLLQKQDNLPATPIVTPIGTPAPTPGPNFVEAPASLLWLAPGRIIADHFEVQKLLGRGAYGEVWKVLDTKGGIEKALKIIMHSMDTEEAKTELQALEKIKNLDNPFILRTDSYWVQDGRLIIVMELARGGSLRDCLKKRKQDGQGGIPLPELVRYFREAAEALDYLHGEQLVHRDVKPDNILIVGKHAKIADMGLAKLMPSDKSTAASMGGSAPYMAPEVWNERVSYRSDQYSLVVAYAELRQGRLPFKGSKFTDYFLAHTTGAPHFEPSILEAEREVILKGLSKNPGQRFISCQDFIEALELVLPRKRKKVPTPTQTKDPQLKTASTETTSQPPANTGVKPLPPKGPPIPDVNVPVAGQGHPSMAAAPDVAAAINTIEIAKLEAASLPAEIHKTETTPDTALAREKKLLAEQTASAAKLNYSAEDMNTKSVPSSVPSVPLTPTRSVPTKTGAHVPKPDNDDSSYPTILPRKKGFTTSRPEPKSPAVEQKPQTLVPSMAGPAIPPLTSPISSDPISPSGTDSQFIPSLRAGEKIRNFLLLEKVPGGKYAEVWKVLDTVGGVEKALRIIKDALHTPEAQLESKAYETYKNLQHPFLLRTEAAFQEHNRLFIVMEWMGGGTLRDLLKNSKAQGEKGMPPFPLLGLMQEVAQALDYLHGQKVLHRDIKAANILLNKEKDHAKIADLGLAKPMMEGSKKSTLVGTPANIAPEVWNEKGCYPSSDQYSLAATYAELRQGETASLGGIPNLQAKAFGAKEREVMLKAMAPDHRDRYPSCGEFLTALTESVRKDPEPQKDKPRAPRKNNRLLAMCAMVMVFAVAMAVVTALIIPKKDSELGSGKGSVSVVSTTNDNQITSINKSTSLEEKIRSSKTAEQFKARISEIDAQDLGADERKALMIKLKVKWLESAEGELKNREYANAREAAGELWSQLRDFLSPEELVNVGTIRANSENALQVKDLISRFKFVDATKEIRPDLPATHVKDLKELIEKGWQDYAGRLLQNAERDLKEKKSEGRQPLEEFETTNDKLVELLEIKSLASQRSLSLKVLAFVQNPKDAKEFDTAVTLFHEVNKDNNDLLEDICRGFLTKLKLEEYKGMAEGAIVEARVNKGWAAYPEIMQARQRIRDSNDIATLLAEAEKYLKGKAVFQRQDLMKLEAGRDNKSVKEVRSKAWAKYIKEVELLKERNAAEWKNLLEDCQKADATDPWIIACREECKLELGQATSLATLSDAADYPLYVRSVAFQGKIDADSLVKLNPQDQKQKWFAVTHRREKAAKILQDAAVGVREKNAFFKDKQEATQVFTYLETAGKWLNPADGYQQPNWDKWNVSYKTAAALASLLKTNPQWDEGVRLARMLKEAPEVGPVEQKVFRLVSADTFKILRAEIRSSSANGKDKKGFLAEWKEPLNLFLASGEFEQKNSGSVNDKAMAQQRVRMLAAKGWLLHIHQTQSWADKGNPHEQAWTALKEAYRLASDLGLNEKEKADILGRKVIAEAYKIGLDHLPKDKLTELKTQAMEAIRGDENNPNNHSALALILLSQARLERKMDPRSTITLDACKAGEKAWNLIKDAAKDEDWSYLCYLQSSICLDLGNFGYEVLEHTEYLKKAEEFGRKVMKSDNLFPPKELVCLVYGNALEDLELLLTKNERMDYTEAIETFKEGLKSAQDSSLHKQQFLLALGRCYHRWFAASGKKSYLDKSLQYYTEVRAFPEIRPAESAECHYFLGMNYRFELEHFKKPDGKKRAGKEFVAAIGIGEEYKNKIPGIISWAVLSKASLCDMEYDEAYDFLIKGYKSADLKEYKDAKINFEKCLEIIRPAKNMLPDKSDMVGDYLYDKQADAHRPLLAGVAGLAHQMLGDKKAALDEFNYGLKTPSTKSSFYKFFVVYDRKIQLITTKENSQMVAPGDLLKEANNLASRIIANPEASRPAQVQFLKTAKNLLERFDFPKNLKGDVDAFKKKVENVENLEK